MSVDVSSSLTQQQHLRGQLGEGEGVDYKGSIYLSFDSAGLGSDPNLTGSKQISLLLIAYSTVDYRSGLIVCVLYSLPNVVGQKHFVLLNNQPFFGLISQYRCFVVQFTMKTINIIANESNY